MGPRLHAPSPPAPQHQCCCCSCWRHHVTPAAPAYPPLHPCAHPRAHLAGRDEAVAWRVHWAGLGHGWLLHAREPHHRAPLLLGHLAQERKALRVWAAAGAWPKLSDREEPSRTRLLPPPMLPGLGALCDGWALGAWGTLID